MLTPEDTNRAIAVLEGSIRDRFEYLQQTDQTERTLADISQLHAENPTERLKALAARLKALMAEPDPVDRELASREAVKKVLTEELGLADEATTELIERNLEITTTEAEEAPDA